MSYAHLGALKTYLGIGATTTDDDTLLQDLLDRVSARFARETGLNFSAETDTRYYEVDAVNGCYLYLDRWLLSVTTLTNGDSSGTTIASTEYWLWSRNSGPPYYAIRLKTDSDYSWEVDTDYMITVAGTWGWSTTPPADVVKAIIEWAAYCYAAKDTPGALDTTVFPDAGIITIPKGIPADVKMVIDGYRERVGWG